MGQKQSQARVTTSPEVKDNRHAVPDFHKWDCNRCKQKGNKMKNVKCRRCRVERKCGTVAADVPNGDGLDIVWRMIQKDDNGNERWEWRESYDLRIVAATEHERFQRELADMDRLREEESQGPQWTCTDCGYSKTRSAEMRCGNCRKVRMSGTWGGGADGLYQLVI